MTATPADGPHILIVDDEPLMRDMNAQFIQQQYNNAVVVTAEHGADGLEKLATMERADVILTDGNMPGMTGFELARRIHENPTHEHTPIILISGGIPGMSISAFNTAVQTAGFAAYLQKPYQITQFYAAIDAALGRTTKE